MHCEDAPDCLEETAYWVTVKRSSTAREDHEQQAEAEVGVASNEGFMASLTDTASVFDVRAPTTATAEAIMQASADALSSSTTAAN